MARRLIAFVVMSLWLVAMVPVARADTGNIIEEQHNPPNAGDGWQAGTCIEDEPQPSPTVFCSPSTKERFYTQAAGHPPMGFTQYIIRHGAITLLPSPPFPPGSATAPLEEPIEGRTIKTLRVDLPPGLTNNPQATEKRCSLA